jgi:hypothetical protein
LLKFYCLFIGLIFNPFPSSTLIFLRRLIGFFIVI